MQKPAVIATVAALCLLASMRFVSSHAIDDRNRGVPPGLGDGEIIDEAGSLVGRNEAEARVLDLESIFGGIAKSMITRTGGTSSQLLSLNLSNVVLMLVLKGLIWGASYVQGGGKGRSTDERGPAAGAAQDDAAAVSETDLLLFLGYMAADESGRYDCLNRVACEHPAKAEGYLRSAEMMWKTAKMFEGIVSMDEKYERMLTTLQEAIEDGRANGDCPAKYKCSDVVDEYNVI